MDRPRLRSRASTGRGNATMLEADLVRGALLPVMVAGAIAVYRTRRFITGRLMILIGTLHLSGLWVGREAVMRIIEGGWVNQADSAVGNLPARADQELVLWFTLWGLLTILLGQLLIALERNGMKPPASLGYQLFLLNVGCAILLPKGGFWWVLLPAFRIIRRR